MAFYTWALQGGCAPNIAAIYQMKAKILPCVGAAENGRLVNFPILDPINYRQNTIAPFPEDHSTFFLSSRMSPLQCSSSLSSRASLQ